MTLAAAANTLGVSPAPPAVAAGRGTERRSPFGDQFLLAFRGEDEPLSFDDLARATDGRARYSDVVRWIARALAAGLVADAGYDTGPDGRPVGPRRYVLTGEGRRRIGMDRRGRRL